MLKVQFAALDTAASDITRRAAALEARLAQLDQDLAPLRADWNGGASMAYQGTRTEWTAALDQLRTLLAQIGAAVAASNADYHSSERLNISRW